MIRILHIVLGLHVGGLEKVVLDLVGNCSPDIEPIVVCLEERGELGHNAERLHIIELAKKPGVQMGMVGKLIKIINKYDIDLIHTHNAGPHFYGSIAGFLTRRPVIHTKHGRDDPAARRKVMLNRLSSLLTDKVVAVSDNAADVCREVESVPPAKVAVILNGIDTDLFCPAKDVAAFGDNMPVRIGIVARLAAEKDHNTLLHACKLLAVTTHNFHLHIIGDGPLRSALEQTVKELNLDGYVTFSGMCHDIPNQLKQVDVFVLSSTTEGISLTLLEAMATSLPIVATRVGGNPEVLLDGETGWLVPPGDPAAMAEKLLCLINDPILRQRMGEKGRERVVRLFSIRETAFQYETLYRNLLKGS